MMVELPRLKCPYCNYEWVPRVPQPRKCPRCRNVIWRLDLRELIVKEKDEAEGEKGAESGS
jgi:predicted Zn-ribbon and HTH transcriptional regulator